MEERGGGNSSKAKDLDSFRLIERVIWTLRIRHLGEDLQRKEKKAALTYTQKPCT